MKSIRTGLARRLAWIWHWIHFPEIREALAIKSHLTSSERVKLFTLSKNLQSIAEIGSYTGASACCFGAAISVSSIEHGHIYCIDTWQNDAMTEGNWDTWEEFQKNTESFSQFIIPIRGLSVDVVGKVIAETQSLDLLFVDGDHSYPAVKADWETYKGLLKSKSIVVFHDSGWAEGVKRVIKEDVEPLVAEYEALPNMWWGVIR